MEVVPNRAWQGNSFDQLVLKGQGDTVSEKFFPLHDARVYQCLDLVTESSEEEND